MFGQLNFLQDACLCSAVRERILFLKSDGRTIGNPEVGREGEGRGGEGREGKGREGKEGREGGILLIPRQIIDLFIIDSQKNAQKLFFLLYSYC